MTPTRSGRDWLRRFHAGLFNPDARRERLWLLRAQRELDEAHRTGLVTTPRFHALRASVLGRLGEFDAALVDARIALQLHPTPNAGHFDLARSSSCGASHRSRPAPRSHAGLATL